MPTQHRAKTIVVYSGGGGVGKTLIATNLAVGLQQQDIGRVLFIDAGHPIPGEAITLVGLERAKSLGDMVPLLGRLTPDVFATYLVTAPSGFSVMPLVTEVLQARLITPENIARMFELANAAFDLIVIDMPTGAGPLTSHFLDRSDYVCVVSDAAPSSVTRARHCLDLLRSLQIPTESLLFCVNRMPERGGMAPERLERLLGVRILVTLPDDPEPVTAAAARSTPILIGMPRHAISRAIDRLGREISQRGLRDLKVRSTMEAPAEAAVADEEVRELKLTIHRRLIEEIDLRKADLTYLRDPVKLQELRTRAEGKVMSLLDEEGGDIHSREMRRKIVKEVIDEALGLGPLEDFLADSAVTEIMVNRPDQIYVERAGKLTLTPAKFLNNEQLRGVIERIVAPLGRRIDEKVPMVDARLRDGSRVNAIIPPLSLKGPALTIRKFSKKLLGVQDLIGYGSLTEQMSTFLGAAVRARLNIVISGGTGSGKTTLLNVLASYIPDDERILTLEDSAELQLPQEHVVTLESRPANIEGEGAITIRDLVRNALRMRPDRIVVGECRGGEALDMLQAMNTGHDGSLTTVHANAPRDALSRLETMALMAGLELPSRAIRDQISSAINLIIQQTRLQDGTRRVTHITEVTGQENGVFTTADVFVFKQTGLAPDGKIYGQYVPTGYIPAFIETLGRRGIKVPREIFLHQTA
ncbi:MAG: Flp pilus assembly complex ATPase component TadA [Acidobacteria bacterium]|nr:Flp pilus assembly complex ATPase component TadA [Acidobacteriota bacterium]